MQNTLQFETMASFKSVTPIAIDWNPNVYEHYCLQLKVSDAIVSFDEIDLSIEEETLVGQNIVFGISYEDYSCKYRMTIENSKMIYTQINGDGVIILRGNSEESLEDFLEEFPMTVFYHDDSISYGLNYCAPKRKADEIPNYLMTFWNWKGVDLSKESQHSAPYETDSIQYYVSQKIKPEYEYIIDDDGSGEIADLVGIKNSEHSIDITLYHLKYAIKGKVSNSIKNLYEVCGQAQKSVRWKYYGGSKIFDHILKRNEYKENQGKSSRLLKGTVKDIIKLREEASNKKKLLFHVVIVQPGMSLSNSSHEMKILLGSTVQILHEQANIDCRVICSK